MSTLMTVCIRRWECSWIIKCQQTRDVFYVASTPSRLEILEWKRGEDGGRGGWVKRLVIIEGAAEISMEEVKWDEGLYSDQAACMHRSSFKKKIKKSKKEALAVLQCAGFTNYSPFGAETLRAYHEVHHGGRPFASDVQCSVGGAPLL